MTKDIYQVELTYRIDDGDPIQAAPVTVTASTAAKAWVIASHVLYATLGHPDGYSLATAKATPIR